MFSREIGANDGFSYVLGRGLMAHRRQRNINSMLLSLYRLASHGHFDDLLHDLHMGHLNNLLYILDHTLWHHLDHFLCLQNRHADTAGRPRPLWLSNNQRNSTAQASVIFFAGVEGSGHHFLEAIMRQTKYTEIGMPWPCGGTWTRTGIPELVRSMQRLRPGDIAVLPQQHSYPCGALDSHDQRRDRARPVIPWLLEAAQQANVALDVIFLSRELEDCLAADCLHRRFERCPAQAATLAANGLELARQLRAVPNEAVHCFPFGNLGVMEQTVRKLFPGRQAGRLVRELWRDKVGLGRRNSEPGWDSDVRQLAEADAELSRECKAHKRLSIEDLAGHAHTAGSEET